MTLINVKAVIFDNDGCLQAHNPKLGYGDPENHYYAAFEFIAQIFGRHLDKGSDLRRKVMGIDIREVGRLMIEGLPLPIQYAAWKKLLDTSLLSAAPYAEIAPGGGRLISELISKNLKVGVASSATREILAAKWNRHSKLQANFACFVAGDDCRVKKSKPEPYLLLAAAQDLHLPPANCVYVGDSTSDIKAAQAAQMISIAVPSGNRSKNCYWQAGADYVVNTLPEILYLFP